MTDRAKAPVETAELRYLEPGQLCFQRHGARLRLTIAEERSYLEVSIIRAFPLSEPGRYLSVRDRATDEIGIIVDPSGLDAASRRLVAEELERRYLVPVIRRVLSVSERFGTVDWTVETDRGVRSFTTRNLREHTVRPAPGRFLLGDVDGNRYDVRDLDRLDRMSQVWLMRHL